MPELLTVGNILVAPTAVRTTGSWPKVGWDRSSKSRDKLLSDLQPFKHSHPNSAGRHQ